MPLKMAVDESILRNAENEFVKRQFINTQKIRILTTVILKLTEKFPKMKEILKEEIDDLTELIEMENNH